MQRSEDSAVRSRSPTERNAEPVKKAGENTPASISSDRSQSITVFFRAEVPASAVGAPVLTGKPSMPYFLQLSDMDIARKFSELNGREKVRLQQGQFDPQWAVYFSPQCMVLDRYLNIQPWAKNRVKLNVPDGKSDYINASHISLHHAGSKSTDKNKYIAMQGPKQATVSHAWRMVWEQVESPGVIVMLTEFEEGGREKCYRYFPKDSASSPLVINEHDEFGDGFKATVSFSGDEVTLLGDCIEVRKLIMRLETPVQGNAEEDEKDSVKVEEKVIWHLLYNGWPDFGVPGATEVDKFLALMELSRAKNVVPDNPRIIHCSAGVGRSGTFIALEYLVAELEAGAMVYYSSQDMPGRSKGYKPSCSRYDLTPPPPVFDLTPPVSGRWEINLAIGSRAHHAAIDKNEKDIVFDAIDRLREQRKMTVQADGQFEFIYRVLKRRWEVKYYGADTKTTESESQDPFI